MSGVANDRLTFLVFLIIHCLCLDGHEAFAFGLARSRHIEPDQAPPLRPAEERGEGEVAPARHE
jgi:hypothetical protein